MQVQLIVADEQRSGQVIPVNVPSFMIGRAEGCNLRSRSSQVSRFHCTITVSNGTVLVQDLGGENGTFVNGNRVSAAQTLKDGDKLVVGTHSFVVSIKAGAGKAKAGEPAASQDDFFELTPSAVSEPRSEQSDTTRPAAPDKTAVMKENAKKPEQEAAEIMFEIRLDGQRVSVTKGRLFDLARRGSVLPDDLVVVAGTKVFADSIQGIVFGDKSSAPPPVASSTGSAVQAPAASATPPPASSNADPFAFPDLGNVAGEANFYDNVVSEPFVRVARRESAVGAIWSALDISFSRVYTIEGNNLVIHSLKALYYVLVVVCGLFIFWTIVNFGTDWYNNENPGALLEELRRHYIALATATFGGITIIVIVRVLLEMLLLAWIESARAEQENDKNDEGKG
jgi:pSer/pThr/pTyr-binding forkhead associated (FHA) protein